MAYRGLARDRVGIIAVGCFPLVITACIAMQRDDSGSRHDATAYAKDESPLDVPAPVLNRYVLTQHNDPQRTGQYLAETKLNYANVQQQGMSVKFHLYVDGDIDTQPLYKPADAITPNNDVVYTATMSNTVYAFDANSGQRLWSVHLADPNDEGTCAPLRKNNTLPADICALAAKCFGRGIQSTPVIDLAKGYMYVVYATQNTRMSSAPGAWQPPTNDGSVKVLPPVAAWKTSDGSDSAGAGTPGTRAQYWTCRNNWVTGNNDPACPAATPTPTTEAPGACPPAIGKPAKNVVSWWLTALDLRNNGNIVARQEISGQSGLPQFPNNVVTFNPMAQQSRPGLLLSNGNVYIGFGASSEYALAYHGWVFGYSTANLTTSGFTPVSKPFVTGLTLYNEEGAGVWEAGGGITADPSGNIYISTGNGTNQYSGDFKDAGNYGNSVIELDPNLNMRGIFTPNVSPEGVDHQQNPDGSTFTYSYWLDRYDLDFGGGGTAFINENNGATQGLLAGGKTGVFYLLNPTPNTATQPPSLNAVANQPGQNKGFRAFVDGWPWQQIKPGDMEYAGGTSAPHLHGAPVYWHSPDGNGRVIAWAEKDRLKSFVYNVTGSAGPVGTINPTPYAVGDVLATPVIMPGGMLSLSANGSQGGSGIVWATLPTYCPRTDLRKTAVCGMLLAYDAFTLTRLFSTHLTNAAGLSLNAPHWAPPTIADGHVFLSTHGGPGAAAELQIYELGQPAGTRFLQTSDWAAPYDTNWNGENSLPPHVTAFCTGSQTCKLADVNGDGLKDLVAFSNDGTGAIWVALSNGWGFSAGQLWNASGICTTGQQCEMGDVDGDGKADVVVFTKAPQNLAIAFLSNGTSAFGAQQLLSYFFCLQGESCHVADINGDGRADIIDFQNGVSGNTGVWVDLAGVKPNPWTTSDGFPGGSKLWYQGLCNSGQTCAIGDVDGDGEADAIAFDPSTGIWVGRSNGTNGFAAPVNTPGATGCGGGNRCLVADVTGDHKADVVVIAGSNEDVYTSAGLSFNSAASWGSLAVPQATPVFAGDVNGDNLADIVQVDPNGNYTPGSAQYVSLAAP